MTVTGQNFAEFAAGNIKCMIDGVFVATDLTNAAADDTVRNPFLLLSVSFHPTASG